MRSVAILLIIVAILTILASTACSDLVTYGQLNLDFEQCWRLGPGIGQQHCPNWTEQTFTGFDGWADYVDYVGVYNASAYQQGINYISTSQSWSGYVISNNTFFVLGDTYANVTALLRGGSSEYLSVCQFNGTFGGCQLGDVNYVCRSKLPTNTFDLTNNSGTCGNLSGKELFIAVRDGGAGGAWTDIGVDDIRFYNVNTLLNISSNAFNVTTTTTTTLPAFTIHSATVDPNVTEYGDDVELSLIFSEGNMNIIDDVWFTNGSTNFFAGNLSNVTWVYMYTAPNMSAVMNWTAHYNDTVTSHVFSADMSYNPLLISQESPMWWSAQVQQTPGFGLLSSYYLVAGAGRTENCTINVECPGDTFNVSKPCESAYEVIYMANEGPCNATLNGIDNHTDNRKTFSLGTDFIFSRDVCTSDSNCTSFMFCARTHGEWGYCDYRYILNYRVDPGSILFYWKAWVGTGYGIGNESTNPPQDHYFILYANQTSASDYTQTLIPVYNLSTISIKPKDYNITGFDIRWPYVYISMSNRSLCDPYSTTCKDTLMTRVNTGDGSHDWVVPIIKGSRQSWVDGMHLSENNDYIFINNGIFFHVYLHSWQTRRIPETGVEISYWLGIPAFDTFNDYEKVTSYHYYRSCNVNSVLNPMGSLELNKENLLLSIFGDSIQGFSVYPQERMLFDRDCTINYGNCDICKICGGSGNGRILGIEEYDGSFYTMCLNKTSQDTYIIKSNTINYPRDATALSVYHFNAISGGTGVALVPSQFGIDDATGDMYVMRGYINKTFLDLIAYEPIIYKIDQTVTNLIESRDSFYEPVVRVIPGSNPIYGTFANGTCTSDSRYCPWYGYERYYTTPVFAEGNAVIAKSYLVVSSIPITNKSQHTNWSQYSPSYGAAGQSYTVMAFPGELANNTGIDLHITEGIFKSEQTEVRGDRSPSLVATPDDRYGKPYIHLNWNIYQDYNPDWVWCISPEPYFLNSIGRTNSIYFKTNGNKICNTYAMYVTIYNESGSIIPGWYERDIRLKDFFAKTQNETELDVFLSNSPHFGSPDIPIEYNHTYKFKLVVNTYRITGVNQYTLYQTYDEANITIQGCLDEHYPRMCPDSYTCLANDTGERECIKSPSFALHATQQMWGTGYDVYNVLLNVTYINGTQVEPTCSNLVGSKNERKIIYFRQRSDEQDFVEIGTSNGTFTDSLPVYVEGTDGKYKYITDTWTYRAYVYCGTLSGWTYTDFTMGECLTDSNCPVNTFCKTWPDANYKWAPRCIPQGGNNSGCYRNHECLGLNCSTNGLNFEVGDYPTGYPQTSPMGGYDLDNKGICYGNYQLCFIDSYPDPCSNGSVCRPFYLRQNNSLGFCQSYLGPGDNCIFHPSTGSMTHMTYACQVRWDNTLPPGYSDEDNWMPMTSWCDPSLICNWHVDPEDGPTGQCAYYSNPIYADHIKCGPGGSGPAARCNPGEYCLENSTTKEPQCIRQKPFGTSCSNDFECETKQCMGIDYAPNSLVSQCSKMCYTCEAECLDLNQYISCNWDFTINPDPPRRIIDTEGFCDVYNERCVGDKCLKRVGMCNAYYVKGLDINEITCPPCDDSSDCEVGLECSSLVSIGYKGCVYPTIYCDQDKDCNMFTQYCDYNLAEKGYKGKCVQRLDDGSSCVRQNADDNQLCQMGEYCKDGFCTGMNPYNSTLGSVQTVRREGDTCYHAEAPQGWEENDMFIMTNAYEFGTCSYINCSATGDLHNSGPGDIDHSCADAVGDRAPAYVFCVGDPNLVHRISGAGKSEESNIFKYEVAVGIDHYKTGYCMWKSEVGESCYADVECTTGECVGEQKTKSGNLPYECTCNETFCDCSGDLPKVTNLIDSTKEYLHDIPNLKLDIDCICNGVKCWSNNDPNKCRILGPDWDQSRVLPHNISEYKDLIFFETGINCTISPNNDSGNVIGCQYYGPQKCQTPCTFNGTRCDSYAYPACGLPWNETGYDKLLTVVYNVTYITAGKCSGIECDASWGDGVKGEKECPERLPVCNQKAGYCEPATVEITLTPLNGIKLDRDVEGEFFQSCSQSMDGMYTVKTNGIELSYVKWHAEADDGDSDKPVEETISNAAITTIDTKIDLCEFLGLPHNDDEEPDHEIVDLYITGTNLKNMKTYKSRVYEIRVAESEFNFGFADCKYKKHENSPYCNISMRVGDNESIVCSSEYDIIVDADAPIRECTMKIGRDTKTWNDSRIIYMTSDKYGSYNKDVATAWLNNNCTNFNKMYANYDNAVGDNSIVILHDIREYSYITVSCTDYMNVTKELTYARNPVDYLTSYDFTYEQQVFLMMVVFLLVPALILLFAGRSGI